MTDTLQQRIQQQQRLKELRTKLLRLHKMLLEMERVLYEQFYGQVSRGQLLQLVINHEQFAWLHRISRLILQIDDLIYADEPVTADTITTFLSGVRQLLTPSESGDDFAVKYDRAIQADAEVGMIHADVMSFLAS